MTTKLKIDLSQGILEVEGSESFVKIMYNDFKAYFAGPEAVGELKPARRTRRTRAKAETVPPEPVVELVETAPKPVVEEVEVLSPPVPPTPEPAVEEVEVLPPLKQPPSPAYTVIKELELGPAKGRPSLVEFMDSKFPLTNEERNIVFLYYLQHNLKLKAITPDHIYTCYKQAKIRVPLNLESSLHITAASLARQSRLFT